MSKRDPIFGDVLSSYTLEEALHDGVLVELYEHMSPKLSGGKPIVATCHAVADVTEAGLMEIWNQYVVWKRQVMPTVPEEDRLFAIMMNGRKIWVDETDEAITMMYPEEC